MYLTKVIHADNFSRLVAVKLLHPRWSENEEIASRMRDEARLLGWLRHKNIVDVMDLTLIDGRCAVMMEYLEAVDAKVAINHCKKNGTRIPLRASLEMCASVASALDAAYNRPPYAGEKPLRVIHRDIKPSNIMIDDSGLVKVLDFGVARAEFDERESKTQEMAFGSLEYMPPERLFFEPESPASDVYSLGATLYELLALEKFGKAKLRPAEHEQYFEDRFDVLLDRYPLHDEAEKLLHELLMDMLEFDEPERPSAADCVSRMRAFARRLPEGPLEEWAETLVPTLLREERDADETTSPGSLVGMVLTEDPKALDEGSVWDENTGMSTQAIDLGALDDEMTGSLADDARWRALKQATIEDMEKRGELPPGRSDPRLSTRRASLEKAEAVATRSPTPPQVARKTVESPAHDEAPEPPELEHATPTPEATQRMALPREIRRMQEEPEELATPTPALSSQPAPSGGRRGLLITAMLMFGIGGFLACVLLGVLAIAAAWSLSQPKPPTPVPSPVPVVVPPKPVAPTGPSTTFVSKFPGTTRFRVSCTNGTASGTDSATVAGEALGKCRITAQTADRKKASTYVENPEPREYVCFAGGSEDCE